MQKNPASFRDPSGSVYEDASGIYRTIASDYGEEWTALRESGLLSEAVDRKQLISFEEVTPPEPEALPRAWKYLRVTRLPFISYPYEWSFSQLQQAALLTLDLHLQALEKGFTLKDASAYNVQFLDGRPIFIDLLSFERWKEGRSWQAYGQFCTHFLAPLALMAFVDLRCGTLSRQWIDGVPLDFACRLLPWRLRMKPGLGMHLFLHAHMRDKHADGRAAAEKVKKNHLSLQNMKDVAQSLRACVASLSPCRQTTEWGDYYTDTNYTDAAAQAKAGIVRETAARHPGALAVDIGANDGTYSRLLGPSFHTVLATDFDPMAVERHARQYANESANILPLVVDALAPTPAIGWANEERASFAARCKADFLLALAVCHHLVITGGIPLERIALWFSSLLRNNGIALVEFVPRADSQVERLLAARDDIFTSYTEENFIAAFAQAGFTHLQRHELPESCRTLHVFQKARPCFPA